MSTPANFAEMKLELIHTITTVKTGLGLLAAVQAFSHNLAAQLREQETKKEMEEEAIRILTAYADSDEQQPSQQEVHQAFAHLVSRHDARLTPLHPLPPPPTSVKDMFFDQAEKTEDATEPEVKKDEVADPTVHPVAGKLKDATEDKELLERIKKVKAVMALDPRIDYPVFWIIDPAVKNKKTTTLPTHYIPHAYALLDRHHMIHKCEWRILLTEDATASDVYACYPEDYVAPPTNKDE
jgi:hypothetical protein